MNKVNGDWLLLCLVLVVFACFWAISPQHLVMSDPSGYSKLAYALSNGEFLDSDPGNIFAHRLGVTLPTALFYTLFGVTIYTTNLWPFMAAIITLTTIWFSLPSRHARLIAVTLCATNVVFLEYSAHLYPDLVSAAFMALSTLFLVNRENYQEVKHGWIYAVIAIVWLFVAFLAKLSAYWVAPVWILVFSVDMKNRRFDLFRHFYLPALVTGLSLGTLYLVYNQWAWGDPLIRFRNVSSIVEAGLWAISGPDAGDVIFRRLTVAPAIFLFNNLGAVLVPALIATPFLPKSMRIWVYYSLFNLLFFWFGTTSLSSYQPLPLIGRYLLPALPGLCILTAYFIANLRLHSPKLQKTLRITLSGIVIAFSVYHFNTYVSEWKQFLWIEKHAVQIVKSDLEKNPKLQFLVISLESRSPSSLKFFFGYEYPDNLQFVSAADFDGRYTHAQLAAFDRIYLYQNRTRASFLNREYGQALYDMSALEQNSQRLFDMGGITVDLRQ